MNRGRVPAKVTASNASAVIRVEGLEKTYSNGTKAVRGVSFSIEEGEIFGLLGPNGAGKSTTIGILGTLVRPTAGSAHVAGLDVTKESMKVRARIGFAMQEAGVDALATGREFLVLQGRLYGLSKETCRRRARKLLTLFELDDAADKRIGGYSGGMKRRIDLAAALIHLPRIVFLDEPTEGLDPRGRQRLWRILRRINRQLGATVLLSTHYMEEADALCDRIAIIDQGRIVAQDTPAGLKATVGGQSLVLDYGAGASKDTLAKAQQALGAGEGGRSRLSGTQVHVYREDAAASAPAILRRLDQAGVTPQSLAIHQPTLDDVYLRYTGRMLEEAEKSPEEATA